MNLAALDPALMFTLLLAAGALSAVGAFGATLIHRDQTSARLKMITERRRELAREAVDALRGKSGGLPRHRRWSTLQTIVGRLRLIQADSLAKLKQEMIAAGWRDPSTPALFITGVCVFPLIFGALGVMWAKGPGFVNHPMMQLLIPVGMASAGVLLPRLWLVNTVTKRRQAIGKSFPNALDLIVICVEAGLSAEAAFNRVTEEMAASSPAIAEEFGLLAAELAFLPDRRKPLENLAIRTGMPVMKSLSTTLLQSEKYGTPVALGIRVLAQENREARMSAAEKKAASLPAKLTVPMILFFMPVLFAVIGGPAYIRATGLN